MNQPPEILAPALSLFQQGDISGARNAAEAALINAPSDAEVQSFAGLMATQMGDHGAAETHFRAVLLANPQDQGARLNLAMTLLNRGALDEAGVVSAAGDGNPRLARITAYVHQQRGRLAEAVADYERVVAAFPDDFESWTNLGNVHADLGNWDAGLAATRQALKARPDMLELVMNLSDMLGRAEKHEERRAVMYQAVEIDPDVALVQTELGLAESSLRNFDAAEEAFRRAIALAPAESLSPTLELAMLLENNNRIDDLEKLVEEGEANSLPIDEMRFVRAWVARRRGQVDEAIALAEGVPESINPIRRAHVLGELYDRRGDASLAFAQFMEMNRQSVSARPVAAGRASYRQNVDSYDRLFTTEWMKSWTPLDIDPSPPAPIFIVGFPRSGTTLLDTLLMNIPDYHVLEEMPVLMEVEHAIAPGGNYGMMTADEAQYLRGLYFEVLGRISPPAPGRTVIDKHPLHMARLPLIDRVFPDARIVLVERHPCDVVLSCFMANFQLNSAMRSFTDLEEAARTYDAVFSTFAHAEKLLPVKVHRVRYERMVQDLEGEMKPLLSFLGREWDPSVLDNQGAAARRGHVKTASYAQVGQPIYKTALARWERYREQMEPVLPILAPWAEKMGYTI